MANAKDEGERFSLKRWSQRKREAVRQAAHSATTAPLANAPVSASSANAPLTNAPAPGLPDAGLPDVIVANALPSDADRFTRAAPVPDSDRSTLAAPATETPLPPVASLTFESDFRGFLQPKVDEAVKRAALKKLFSDPRFNVMDRLDVYIDDYSQPDPLPREWLRELASAQNILNPPQTRVNDQGFAEDVPPVRADTESASTRPEETATTTELVSAPTSASEDAPRTTGADLPGVLEADPTHSPAMAHTIAVDPTVPTPTLVASTAGSVKPRTVGGDAERCPISRKPA